MKTFVECGILCTHQVVSCELEANDIEGSAYEIAQLFVREEKHFFETIPGLINVKFEMESHGYDGAIWLMARLTRPVTDAERELIAKNVHDKMVKENDQKAKRKLKYEELKAEFGE